MTGDRPDQVELLVFGLAGGPGAEDRRGRLGSEEGDAAQEEVAQAPDDQRSLGRLGLRGRPVPGPGRRRHRRRRQGGDGVHHPPSDVEGGVRRGGAGAGGAFELGQLDAGVEVDAGYLFQAW